MRRRSLTMRRSKPKKRRKKRGSRSYRRRLKMILIKRISKSRLLRSPSLPQHPVPLQLARGKGRLKKGSQLMSIRA